MSDSPMLQPRDIVAVFRDDPESGGTIGHYGTVVRVDADAFTRPEDRSIVVLVQGRQAKMFERDVIATGRVDESNPWVNTACTVRFATQTSPTELTGTYLSRVGSFDFEFRVCDKISDTYNLRFPLNADHRHGRLEYFVAKQHQLDRSLVLRAIGNITGELALPSSK